MNGSTLDQLVLVRIQVRQFLLKPTLHSPRRFSSCQRVHPSRGRGGRGLKHRVARGPEHYLPAQSAGHELYVRGQDGLAY
jgi:hypothetical protein